ncbi:VanZ family protein [Streptomyces sp. TRM 70351]|uniref:VanZ family protein n=1 Tax=Streptomyces sp. TRM 70351 TaxID=3116552 RepID=UPI002E7B9D91|nr:VanZ family protein [Streptomyces sp. TRM 70351]MEE1927903.1 VanZ family protein [Streptomyces sp. TRM 70351]
MPRHRPDGRTAARVRTAGRVLLAGYLLVAGWLTLRPRSVPWVDPVNVTPLATLRAEWAAGAQEALAQLSGDLLLLAPLGALLPLASGTLGPRLFSFARTVGAVALVSLAVEVVRTSVPGQTGNVDALLLNTAGAALAHVVLSPFVRELFRRADAAHRAGAAGATEPPRGRTPSSPRVGIAP